MRVTLNTSPTSDILCIFLFTSSWKPNVKITYREDASLFITYYYWLYRKFNVMQDTIFLSANNNYLSIINYYYHFNRLDAILRLSLLLLL